MVHAHYHTLTYFLFFFSFQFLFSFLSFLLYLSLSCSLILSPLCTAKGPFILSVCRVFTILPFNHFCPGVSVLPKPPTDLLAAQPSSLTYASRATSHSQTKSLILFSCSPWNSYPNKGGYSLSLSLMTCT